MGQRSYLYLVKNDEDIPAFEANNSLPFFWLTLIDSKTLESKTKEWLEYENFTQEEVTKYHETNSLNFILDLEKFNRNSITGAFFLQTHFPETVDLYNDFIKSLKSYLKREYLLEIEIDQISAFYETTEKYIEILTKEILAIEQNKREHIHFLNTEDLISSGTGFDSLEEQKVSKNPSYQKALKTRKTTSPKQKHKYNLKSLIYHIIILLICPVFTYVIYKGYNKEGFSGVVIMGIISNIGFYIYSIWEIKAQITAAAYTETDS